jgi:nucleotidyltransferase substrate binding protein (TIGR01987 family)
MNIDTTPRWVYRHINFEKALTKLLEVVQLAETRTLSELENEGMIQRFEYTWELAWNMLKDYLLYRGIPLQETTPAEVLRAAHSAGIIQNGDDWMQAKRARNNMSHRYDSEEFKRVIDEILSCYSKLMVDLNTLMITKRESL